MLPAGFLLNYTPFYLFLKWSVTNNFFLLFHVREHDFFFGSGARARPFSRFHIADFGIMRSQFKRKSERTSFCKVAGFGFVFCVDPCRRQSILKCGPFAVSLCFE